MICIPCAGEADYRTLVRKGLIPADALKNVQAEGWVVRRHKDCTGCDCAHRVKDD